MRRFERGVHQLIALCPNPFRDIDLKLTREADKMLRDAGYETAICPVFADDDPAILPQDICVKKLSDVAEKCTLVIVIGGDGTLLATARALHEYNIPILGVNLGTMGFMTILEPEDLPLILEAAKGNAPISRRMMLDVTLERDGEIIYSDCVLNDAVIHGYGDVVKLTATCEGDTIMQMSGDGIILSTPTGSTGYSMSAGGPIVEPDAENIIITPICAHVMGSRSFVLNPARNIAVKTEKLHGRRAYLSVDGYAAADLANNDIVRVKRSAHYTEMVNLGLKSFYDIAYEKLT